MNLDQLLLPLKLSLEELPPQSSGALGPERPSSPTLSPQQGARYRTRGCSSLYREHPVSVRTLHTPSRDFYTTSRLLRLLNICKLLLYHIIILKCMLHIQTSILILNLILFLVFMKIPILFSVCESSA